MKEQLVIMTLYSTEQTMDVQNRKLQRLLDEGWRITQVTPAGGGVNSHSVVFLLEQESTAVASTTVIRNGVHATVRPKEAAPSIAASTSH